MISGINKKKRNTSENVEEEQRGKGGKGKKKEKNIAPSLRD